MLTKRVFAKSRFATTALVTLVALGPLFQTANAQKPSRGRDTNVADGQRDSAAPLDQRQEAPEVNSLSLNPQRGGLSIPPSRTTPSSPAAPAVCTAALITESSSQAITPGNSVSPLIIAPPGRQDDASYWRAFNIANYVSGTLTIASVDIGVEAVTTGAKAVTVNLWSSSAAFPLGYPNSLSLVGTSTQSLGIQAGTVVNIPVVGTALA